jgi:transcription elongation factor Elf1
MEVTMIWIDAKYANILSVKLERYTVKKHNPFLANFRCPICGDSHKSKTKARGYLLASKNGLAMKCHNCGASMGFDKFIQYVDETLYSQYRLEKFSGKANKKVAKEKFNFSPKNRINEKKTLSNVLISINQLEENHPAAQYCKSRKLPDYKLSYVYYVDDVSKIASVLPEYRDKIRTTEPRLVLPFYDREKTLVGLTMRALDNNKLRYLTVRVDDEKPMIYGYDQVNLSERVICVEGPIDSLFLDNAVAVGGSDMKKAIDLLPDDTIYVFDNQPRNKQICSLMMRTIKAGKTVCIFPNTVVAKDINDMAKMGYKVNDIVRNNVFSGLEAQMQLSLWRKC